MSEDDHGLLQQQRSANLHAEDAGYSDGTSDALQAQGGHLRVVAVLQSHTEGCQQGGPRQLQHMHNHLMHTCRNWTFHSVFPPFDICFR